MANNKTSREHSGGGVFIQSEVKQKKLLLVLNVASLYLTHFMADASTGVSHIRGMKVKIL